MTDSLKKTQAEPEIEFSSVEEIVADLRIGKMVIIVDDEERENEGDLVISSKYLTADHINFMITFGKT